MRRADWHDLGSAGTVVKLCCDHRGDLGNTADQHGVSEPGPRTRGAGWTRLG